jgi:transcriptional regulator with XRE-family HTH domain
MSKHFSGNLARVDFATELGDRIKARRKHRGLTAAALAEKIETSAARLSAWETGKGIPDLPGFVRLCAALHTTPNSLLLGESEPEADAYIIRSPSRLEALENEITAWRKEVHARLFALEKKEVERENLR